MLQTILSLSRVYGTQLPKTYPIVLPQLGTGTPQATQKLEESDIGSHVGGKKLARTHSCNYFSDDGVHCITTYSVFLEFAL